MLEKYPMVSRTSGLVRFATGVPTTISSAPVHRDRVTWKAASNVLNKVALFRRATSRTEAVTFAGNSETNRRGRKATWGCSGMLHNRFDPLRRDFQTRARVSSPAGSQTSPSAPPEVKYE